MGLRTAARVVRDLRSWRIVTGLGVAFVCLAVTGSALSASQEQIERGSNATLCRGQAATISGTSGDDQLLGTDGDDVIAAGAGDDVILALAGDDVVCGEGGNDEIRGRAGDDELHGGRGEDLISAGRGDDELFGRRDSDRLFGNAGDDELDGGKASDACAGGNGDDRRRRCESRASASPVDTPPRAIRDTAITSEDASPSAIAVLANDTDLDGGPKSIAAVSQPARGTVVITGGGTGLTYEPDPNYCDDSGATDDFTYDLAPGGSTATVAVTVSCVDDPPGASRDSAVTSEDAPPGAIAVLANDIDLDGGPKSIAAVSQPAHGAVVITGGGSGLTYEPAPNYCDDSGATDDFTYDLAPGGSTATVAVTVSCVTGSPGLTTSAGTTAYTEGNPAAPVDPGLGVTNPDARLTGATVAITANFASPQDRLDFSNQSGISGTYNGATGQLTLSGDASVDAYRNALRSVGYANSSQNPSTATRTVGFTIRDGTGSSTTEAKDVTVTAVNSAPIAVDGANISTGENSTTTFVAPGTLFNDSDPEGDPITVSQVNGDPAKVGVEFALPDGVLLKQDANGQWRWRPRRGL